MGNIWPVPLMVYLARLSIVEDQLAKDELHLLRLVPLGWIDNEIPLVVENLPT